MNKRRSDDLICKFEFMKKTMIFNMFDKISQFINLVNNLNERLKSSKNKNI